MVKLVQLLGSIFSNEATFNGSSYAHVSTWCSRCWTTDTLWARSSCYDSSAWIWLSAATCSWRDASWECSYAKLLHATSPSRSAGATSWWQKRSWSNATNSAASSYAAAADDAKGTMYRYPVGRNVPDMSRPGAPGGMLSVPYDMGGGGMLPQDAAAAIPMPVTALALALANATPDQQRTMLGENLYPLVDQLEHDHAAKVTGMLLEMDQTEVLHLLESPDALKAKVAEAMDALKNVHQQANSPLSLSENNLVS